MITGDLIADNYFMVILGVTASSNFDSEIGKRRVGLEKIVLDAEIENLRLGSYSSFRLRLIFGSLLILSAPPLLINEVSRRAN